MMKDVFYLSLDQKEKNQVLGFLTTCILRTRGHMQFTSNSRGFDEDVNVYLAHLLLSLLDPQHTEHVDKYVLKGDQDVFRLIESSNDRHLKQVVYRVNADNLLVSIGIFNNKGTSHKERQSFFGKPRDAYMGRGKAYYQFAAGYSREAGKSFKALTEVLTKLSDGFEKYVDVLTGIRHDYLNFVEKKAPDRFDLFKKDLDRYEKKLILREKTDAFLDLYLKWRENQDMAVKEQLIELAGEIQKLNPHFKIELS